MARIAYYILDDELMGLFEAFGLLDAVQVVGGVNVVPASAYQGYLDFIQEELEKDWDSELWDLWDEIDEDFRIWSTEKNNWV